MTRVCPKCGFENADQTFYCTQCGQAPSNICPKCGFENIVQTFYCSRCGSQIRWLPGRTFEDIDEKSLIESAKKKERSDVWSDYLDHRLLGVLGVFGDPRDALRKETVSEAEWRRAKNAQRTKANAQKKKTLAAQLDSRVPSKESENPFKSNPKNNPSSVFPSDHSEPLRDMRGKRKRKSH